MKRYIRSSVTSSKTVDDSNVKASTDNYNPYSFMVGDQLEWSGLYGGEYKGVVTNVTDEYITVDVMWTAEDTGKLVTNTRRFEIATDPEGRECIIVYRYRGTAGYVYPPSNDYINSAEEYFDKVYGKCISEANQDINTIRRMYANNEGAPSTILLNLGYTEDESGEAFTKSMHTAGHIYETVFNFAKYDWEDGPVLMYVLRDGEVPKGWTVTKFDLYDEEGNVISSAIDPYSEEDDPAEKIHASWNYYPYALYSYTSGDAETGIEGDKFDIIDVVKSADIDEAKRYFKNKRILWYPNSFVDRISDEDYNAFLKEQEELARYESAVKSCKGFASEEDEYDGIVESTQGINSSQYTYRQNDLNDKLDTLYDRACATFGEDLVNKIVVECGGPTPEENPDSWWSDSLDTEKFYHKLTELFLNKMLNYEDFEDASDMDIFAYNCVAEEYGLPTVEDLDSPGYVYDPQKVWEQFRNKITNISSTTGVYYPNGKEVTDIDLDTYLDYNFGTDRDKDNSKYTTEEKQRSVDYWFKKHDTIRGSESTEVINSSYSPDLLNDLVNYYRSFDTMSSEEIWDEIVAEYNNEDLANDVLESLDDYEQDLDFADEEGAYDVYSSSDIKASMGRYDEYYGQTAAATYGDLIADRLKGKSVSKRRDTANEPGGLIYEANKLGIDMWDLLEALEGMCSEGRAKEIDDSTYKIFGASDLADEEDLPQADQEYDSAKTSINSNKLPAIYHMITLPEGSVGIDYGGGKFDNAVEALAEQGVTLYVYDPYNRSQQHNRAAIKALRANDGADFAINSNVLNVIKEPEARLNVLENIKKITKPGAPIYITVYEGSGKGNEGVTKSGYQLNRKTADYLEEIQQVFPNAKRKGKLIVATNSRSVSSSTESSNTSVEGSTDIDDPNNNGWEKRWDFLDNYYKGNLVISKISSPVDGWHIEKVAPNGRTIKHLGNYKSLESAMEAADKHLCNHCGSHAYDENGNVVEASQSYLDRIEELMEQGLDEETASREAYAEFYPDDYDADDYDEIYSATTSSSRYWYFTRHGVQPGSVPKYVNILDIVDTPEGSYFLTDGVILTDDLRNYEIRERKPKNEVVEASKSIKRETVEAGYYDIPEPPIDPPEDDSWTEVDGWIEDVDLDVDAIIEVLDDGSWIYEDETYPWAVSKDSYNGDHYSYEYYVHIGDPGTIVEDFDDVIEKYIPSEEGRYHLKCKATLKYFIEGVEVKQSYYDEEVYKDNASVEFDEYDSKVENVSVERIW